jgi:hypothetical protein
MPTGYTAAIKDGISFEKFVWDCARGMGALVMMRDEPLQPYSARETVLANLPDEHRGRLLPSPRTVDDEDDVERDEDGIPY